MSMNNLIHNEKAQTGVLITFVLGLLIVGFFYVAFGAIMDQFQTANTDFLNSGNVYSQGRSDSMEQLFDYWWAFPIFALILFIVWGIKTSLERNVSEL